MFLPTQANVESWGITVLKNRPGLELCRAFSLYLQSLQAI